MLELVSYMCLLTVRMSLIPPIVHVIVLELVHVPPYSQDVPDPTAQANHLALSQPPNCLHAGLELNEEAILTFIALKYKKYIRKNPINNQTPFDLCGPGSHRRIKGGYRGGYISF